MMTRLTSRPPSKNTSTTERGPLQRARVGVVLALAVAGCAGYASVERSENSRGTTTTTRTADEGGGEPSTVVVAEPVEPVGAPTTPTGTPGLTSHPPITCAGQEQITATDVEIVNSNGPGVRASGQCVVTLTGASVTGSDYGVEATGNARVTITNGRVTGAEAAVVANGNADVQLPGTEVTGEVRVQSGGSSASAMQSTGNANAASAMENSASAMGNSASAMSSSMGNSAMR